MKPPNSEYAEWRNYLNIANICKHKMYTNTGFLDPFSPLGQNSRFYLYIKGSGQWKAAFLHILCSVCSSFLIVYFCFQALLPLWPNRRSEINSFHFIIFKNTWQDYAHAVFEPSFSQWFFKKLIYRNDSLEPACTLCY